MYLSALLSNHWEGVSRYTTGGEGRGKPQLSPTTHSRVDCIAPSSGGILPAVSYVREATDISFSLIHDTHGRVVASFGLPLGARRSARQVEHRECKAGVDPLPRSHRTAMVMLAAGSQLDRAGRNFNTVKTFAVSLLIHLIKG